MALQYTPRDISSGYQSTETLNQNFEDIQTALADGLSRTGDSPNAMEADIDMQAHRIFNLPNAVANGEPLTYGQWAANLDVVEFAGYLQELQIATNGQSSFTTSNSYTPGLGALRVFVNGLHYPASEYVETDANTVDFASALQAGDEVVFIITSFGPVDYDTAATVQYQLPDGTYTSVQAQLNKFYPRSAAEISAGVTPTYYHYCYGDIRRYGAVGDDATDNDAFLNNAALVAAEDGSFMYVPDGTYQFNQWVIPPTVGGIIGLGGTLKVMSRQGVGNIKILGIYNGEATNSNGMIVRGLKINANALGGYVVHAYAPSYMQFCDNYIYNMVQDEINYPATGGAGIRISAYETGGADAIGNQIKNNIILNDDTVASGSGGFHCIMLQAEADYGVYSGAVDLWKTDWVTPGVKTYRVAHTIVSGNYCYGGYYGISLNGASYTTITGNHIAESVRNISIQNLSLGNTVASNLLREPSSSSVHLAFGAQNNLVQGNKIYAANSAGEALIQCRVNAKNNHVIGNSIYTNTTAQYGMFCAIHSDGCMFLNNSIVGKVVYAYIGVESAFDNALLDTAHYGYNKDASVNDYANTTMSDVVVSGNTIVGTYGVPAIFLGQADGISLTRITVSDNKVIGTSYTDQLRIMETNASQNANHILMNNVFAYNSGATDFVLPRGLAHFDDVIGNTVIDGEKVVTFTDADTTPSVKIGRVFKCNNTAPTSITFFDDGKEAREITVKMDVNTTLVHNTSYMRLKGSVDYVPATANAMITLRQFSNIWFEVSRST